MLLKRGDDARGIGDRPAIKPQNGQLTLARRTPDLDQLVRAKHTALVRNSLVVKRPAHFFTEVRERDVPKKRDVHSDLSQRALPVDISAHRTNCRCQVRRGAKEFFGIFWTNGSGGHGRLRYRAFERKALVGITLLPFSAVQSISIGQTDE